ncbi:MAG TPA: hypothetical protein VFY26_10855 [Anaerolineales bacterium]|nr:hypothetical protein [Anaerolineales bacterium]
MKMFKTCSSMFIGAAILLGLVGCSLPGAAPSLTVDEQAATVIAATLLAGTPNGAGVTLTATSSIMPTGTARGTLTSGPTPTITPTYSTPVLKVLESTNCREGPGEEYKIFFTHLPDVELEIVGRYEPTNFWLVKSPQSQTGTCWLWGEYVEVSGSYWVVPTLTPPPTATLAPPQAPSIEQWDFACSGGTMTFNLLWEDRATNEDGYRIFRDGEAIAELPANSTSFSESIPIEAGENRDYYLQVYGPTGSLNTSIMRLSC